MVYETLKPLVGKVDTLVQDAPLSPFKTDHSKCDGDRIKLIDSGAECVREYFRLIKLFELQ